MPPSSSQLMTQRTTSSATASHAPLTTGGRPLAVVRLANRRTSGLALTSLDANCLRRLVASPEDLFSNPVAWLKRASDRRVALISAWDGSAEGLWCCKESLSQRIWVRLISRCVSLRAWNAFRQGLRLSDAGILTPQPLAVIGVTRRGVLHEYLLTEAVDQAVSLQHWLSSAKSETPGADLAKSRDRLARRLGQTLHRLHAHRFDHRDLKATNILVSADERLWIIDLDGVRRWPVLLRFRRVQNLARLWVGAASTGCVSTTTALRFLLAYLTPLERTGWKQWWRDIARRAVHKVKQQQRKLLQMNTECITR